MPTRISATLLILLTCLVWPIQAQQKAPPAEKRVALVIGVGQYQFAPALPNPPNDARRMAEALRRLNFEVDEAIDPDYRAFGRTLREFGIKAAKADAALIFYAGHGVQVEKENFIIPADAKLERERDLIYESLPLDIMLGEVSQARKVGIVLLDACRNNPFTDRISRSLIAARGRGASQGLARVDRVPRNTMVVMATRADEIAEDGTSGEESPFTQAVLAHFRIPGLELSLFFRSVRDTVLKATSNRQEPYVFSSLGAEPFYFNPRPPNRPPEVAQIKTLELTDAAGPTPLSSVVPRPTDADEDPLTVRIIGLPKSGEIRIDGKPAVLNDAVSLEKFMTSTYKPGAVGSAGTYDFLVDDGRGGSVLGVVPIVITSSNRAPVIDAERLVRVYPGTLGITRPADPDGDSLTVTITALPKGVVRHGKTAVKVGDKLRPADLASLTYWGEPETSGDVGALAYAVEDGRGAKSEGKVLVQVAAAEDRIVSEQSVWQRIYERGTAEDVEAFLKLFPTSPVASAAQDRLKELAAAGPVAAPTPAQPQVAMPQAATPRPPEPAPPPPDNRVAAAAPVARPAPRGADATFQDCPECPVMVKVPAGTFLLGQGGDPSVGSPRRVSLRTFAIGQYPVTVAEWRACMADGGCSFQPKMAQAGDRTPIHNVSWEDAQNYVAWLSRKTSRQYRLPSEAEFEYAARANTTTKYWWGNDIFTALANCSDCGKQERTGPMPVGSFQANPFGLFDVHGTVAQWVADCWSPTYQGTPIDGSARDQKNCTERTLRGGSFRSDRENITSVARYRYDSAVRYLANGFRVAADMK